MAVTLIRFIYDSATFELHQTIIPSGDDSELVVHASPDGDSYVDIPITDYLSLSSGGLPVPDLIQQYLAQR